MLSGVLQQWAQIGTHRQSAELKSDSDNEMTNTSTTSGNSPTLSAAAGALDTPSIDWVDVLGHFLEDGHGVEHNKAAPASTSTSHLSAVRPDAHTSTVHNPIISDDTTTATTEKEPSKDVVEDKAQLEHVRAATAKTMSTEGDASEEEQSDEKKLTAAEKAKLRSERKRSREKQRRSDVNTQFADLTALLKKIGAEDAQQDEGRKSFIELSTSSSNMNRVDLIGKTIAVLRRIHNENGKRERSIEELSEELKATKKREDDANMKLQQQQCQPFGKKSDHVMMMVPMMVRPDGGAQPMVMPQTMHSGTVPANFSNMYNPFMFMKPQTQSSSNTHSTTNQNNKPSETSTNQQQFVQMVPMQVPADSGESLAHCA